MHVCSAEYKTYNQASADLIEHDKIQKQPLRTTMRLLVDRELCWGDSSWYLYVKWYYRNTKQIIVSW